MKGDTHVFWAARNVGNSNHETETGNGSVQEFLSWHIKFFARMTLARRIDVAVGRSADEVLNRIAGTKAAREIDDLALQDDIAALMNRAPVDDDDYNGPTADITL